MQLYTLKEVAKIMKMNPETIRRFIRKGELRAALIGRDYRIREEDLNTFLESKRAS